MPNSVTKVREIVAGRVVMVGDEVKQTKPGDLVFFDAMEAIEDLAIDREHGKPIALVYMRESAAIMRWTKDAAMKLGVNYPNLKEVEGLKTVCELADSL